MAETVKVSMRDRLIEAATELFYADGLRSVSVEKVIARTGTTKVTFYRHFKSKDDLVVAHLELRARIEREGIGAAMEHADGDADRTLQLIADQLGKMSCEAGFRGCPFINAAAEYPDPASAVRKTVSEHRTWCKDAFAEIVRPLSPADPKAVAEDLMLLRDGAMVAGYLDDGEALAASFLRSCRAVISAG
ncbi:TetR/AcrR family transcriptional regulator [Arthrobacter sp. zg-Y20]|uniref:TetR/AcrR family transcriptional regulator n=1 Tax=unclassified Arthrobacter TaxID=235627 RepID=UPI001D145986|nr:MULTISPECIES: TetR/AcrR family transcriptional regulator [unclassified Arthrobacter]MCC3274511.1 TetR/AcrR family transcriptional regulator [Arthrobacter sp. zg-Y20]MDK1314668.1 TetR/AcrR family transcriptional regulator [Arthrobacter sp. zg.Y20]MDK1327551.1 TetR/AcrR family transcriptional regulator [Arthrobacter sp. zg-Y1143]WIB07649.1 TetR/AcrR family transcriptional regulator [Arthrobacter sp. zg-Y20]